MIILEAIVKYINPWNYNSDWLSKFKEITKRTEIAALSDLKFIISEDTLCGKNDNSNSIFELRKITLIGDGEETVLTTNTTTKKNYNRLSILLQNREGKEFPINPQLSEKCNNVMLKLLFNGRPDPKYCCFDFFMDSVGLYSNRNVNQFDLNKWEMQNVDEASLNTGDGIIIFDEVQKPVHVAIYLTNGIYVSLFGSTGPLIVTDLNEMKTAFNGMSTYRLNLKNRSIFDLIIYKARAFFGRVFDKQS